MNVYGSTIIIISEERSFLLAHLTFIISGVCFARSLRSGV
jgi:hypothetical protein